MAVRFKLDFPNAVEVMRKLGTDAATAQTKAMAEVVLGWKGDIRSLVKKNFRRTPPIARRRGLNFEKSFQGDSYPAPRRRKPSFDPAGWLRAKAGFAQSFEEGDTVSGGRKRKYLAIALAGAKKLGLDYGTQQRGASRFGKWSGVEAAERRFGTLRPIPTKGGDTILAASTGGKLAGGFVASRNSEGKVLTARARGKKRDFVPLFLLVKAVRLPKKLSFLAYAQRWLNRLPGIMEREAAALDRRGGA